MDEPKSANDYSERDVRAARAVLIELGQILGAWRDSFVVIGGAVPWLLLDQAEPKHVGTLDIDLNLDPAALADGKYATFVEILERSGYVRNVDDLKPFQLARTIVVENQRITVLVDLLMPETSKVGRNTPKLVDGLRVLRAKGADVALEHNLWEEIEGVMPDGRKNRVNLQIASIPALIVMKGYALVGRDKHKDAYDIYYSVKHFKPGIEALADELREMKENPVVAEALSLIAAKFRAEDDFGPVTVRRFLEESEALGDFTADQVQTDAFMQVRALLELVEIKK